MSTTRTFLRDYFHAHRPDWLVFYADHVWEHVDKHGSANALDMEGELAELADVVVIVVESPGTFAELGAFSMQKSLRKKLLVILDSKYKDHSSFINTGPVRWVDKYSKFGESIHCSLEHPATDVSAILTQLDKELPATYFDRIQLDEIINSPKHLLLLIADLVSIIGPATPREIRLIIEDILGGQPKWKADVLRGLALSLSLISEKKANGDMGSDSYLYYRSLSESGNQGLMHRYGFDIRRARAAFINCYRSSELEWSSRFPVE